MKKYEKQLDEALAMIRAEVLRAKEKFTEPFNSVHEGYAVVKEETDELWDEVKAKKFDKVKGQKEAVQSAAMLCRFIVELTGGIESHFEPKYQLIIPISKLQERISKTTPLHAISILITEQINYYGDLTSYTGLEIQAYKQLRKMKKLLNTII